MSKFHWLHFSDLHMTISPSFDTLYAKAQLLSFLKDKKFPCDYIFITGDIANKCNYDGTKKYITRLFEVLGKTGSQDKFWAVGNHDVKRGGRIRQTVIEGIRNARDSASQFEQDMMDDETRSLLTNLGMDDYLKWHNELLGSTPSEAHMHQELLHLNLVVLNTCLTSCDDKDSYKLHIKEPGLYRAFDNLNSDKPTFVIGHHGREFFVPASQTALGALFDSAGVDLYLCGHSHRLGYDIVGEAGRDIHQLTCGGMPGDGSVFSFMHGEYDDSTQTILIKPYSYSESSRRWQADTNLHRRLDGNTRLPLTGRMKADAKRTVHIDSGSPVIEERFRRSDEFFHRLRDPGGRFYHNEFNPALFPDTKDFEILLQNKDKETHNEQRQDKENEPLPLAKVLDINQASSFIFIGEGGAGKTTSLLDIWYNKLRDKKELPLYVALNEYNEYSDEGQSGASKFVADYLKRWYAIDLAKVSEPVILLLDGFNEISGDPAPVVIEIKKLASERNVRVVLTSRPNLIELYNWEGFERYEILQLSSEVVDDFLTAKKLPRLVNESWLSTPMMLTLYARTCAVRRRVESKDVLDFLPDKTKGELIYNFLLCQLAKLVDEGPTDEIYSTYTALFLVAPYIAWKAESSGLFWVKKDELEEQIRDYLKEKESFFPDLFTRYMQKLTNRLRPKLKQTLSPQELLINKYGLLVEESDRYVFAHQYYRDFLSALHIANEISEALAADTMPFVPPEAIRERVLPPYIHEMLGDYYAEYRNAPRYKASTLLHKLLDKLRLPVFSETAETTERRLERHREICGYVVNNIIAIWRKARGDRLIGEDLSQLELSHVTLNGAFFSDNTAAASFRGSIIANATLLPQGHSADVNSAVYSGDGKRVLSASDDRTVREWDRESGECLRVFRGHSDDVTSAVYSGDGKYVLSASWDKTIREWDRESGECLRVFGGHSSGVTSAVYSGDGRRVLSASWDSTTREWDRESGECLQIFEEHSERVTSAVYSGDGKRVLSASDDKTIREWDRESGECQRVFEGHNAKVTSAVYSGDGKLILSASDDKTIREWDKESGECLQIFEEHSEQVTSAVYSGDGKRVLSASWDGIICEWDRETGKCLRVFRGHNLLVYTAVYSDDGKRILSASRDNTIREWDRETGECLRIFEGHHHNVNKAVYGEDGKRVLSASNDKTIREWDMETGECLRVFEGHGDFVSSAVYSEDGKRALSASRDRTVREWDMESGNCLRIFKGHSNIVNSAVYSGDGKRVLSTSYDDTIREWDRENGNCLRIFKGHSNIVSSAVYSGDGKRVLSASYDKTIREWDRESGECLRVFEGHSHVVTSAVYSGDGKHVLSASWDYTIREWNRESGECLHVFEGHSYVVTSAVYNGDGKRVLSTSWDNTIREWDRKSGKCLHVFEGHSNVVASAVYSSDGKRILSASNDNTIREWNRETGECLWATPPYGGINILGCDFRGCEFCEETLEPLVRTFGGKIFRTFLSELRLGGTSIHISSQQKRHLILTGPNGSGKTRLLNDLNKVLLQTLKRGNDEQAVVKPIFFGNDNPGFITDMAAEIEASRYTIAYFPARRDFDKGDFFTYLDELNATRVNSLANKDDINANHLNSWISQIEKALGKLFGDAPDVRLSYEGSPPKTELYQGEARHDRNRLPHGYAAVLDVIGKLFRVWNRTDFGVDRMHGLVLIDEPESHLHVSMQKKILPCLTELFANVQFVVATHSPFVLNSANNAMVYDMEKQVLLSELTAYSYKGLVEHYFNEDMYSQEIKDKYNRYVKLVNTIERSNEDDNELTELRELFYSIPDDRADELSLSFKMKELELGASKGGGKHG